MGLLARPTDWNVLDLDKDPVPGDPYEVRDLAHKLTGFSEDVGSALRSIKGLSGDSALLSWVGSSGDAFREQFGDLPKELDKLERSYRMAGDALAAYWPQLEQAQAKADKALQDGRDARAALNSAHSQLSTANDWVQRAHTESQKYQNNPQPSTPPPNPDDVKAAARNATNAHNAQTAAQSAVNDAQARLDAAKAMAADAAHLRDQAADTCAHALDDASHAGIRNKHWWEKAVDWVADHWDDIVAVCKVIVAVLGVIVMIIGGPLAWVVLAAALVVLADTLVKYSQGKASLWDVAFAALDCIPMFKGLTTAGGLLKMMKEAPALIKSGEALERTANAIRKGANTLRETGRDFKKLVTCGDPIDMATGEMVMSATDVELTGVLPLVLERYHRSSYRGGRWFGTSWSSTLDQRLWIDDQGVRFTTADGMILYYPVPEPGLPVMPVEGPRWPLTWDGTVGGAMTVTQPETGRTLHFTPLTGHNPAQLPITALTDRNANRITVTYTTDGTPHEVVHDSGYRIGVDNDGRHITGLRLLSHEDQPLLLSYGYDTAGNLAEITNSSGLPLKFTYDGHHRITSWEDRNGTWYRYTYDDQGRCTHTTGTDGILDYTYAYDEETHTTRATNSLGHTTVYEFNDTYQLIRETDPLGNATIRTWDRYDNLLSITDPLGRTTRFTYTAQGQVAAAVHPDGTTVAAEYNDLFLPVAVTDQEGSRWAVSYDSRGNAVGVTDPLDASSELTYDERGRLIRSADALGATVSYEPAENGLPAKVTDPLGNETRYAYNCFGQVSEVCDPVGGRQAYGWRADGMLEWRRVADGSTERWTYDAEGNVREHHDAAGGVTRYAHGPFDVLTTYTDASGNDLAFHYDTELRLTKVVNAVGCEWTYEYDAAGRVIRESDFNGRAVSYRYDEAGQLVERCNAAGEVVHYEHDALGRIVRQHSDDGSTTFAYDAVGRLVHARNAAAELRLDRDGLGRVLAETCNGHTTVSVYDPVGRRTSRRTPSGVVSTWTFDRNGRSSALEMANRVMAFDYDAAGREVARQAGSGFKSTQQWDPAHRLVSRVLQAASGHPQRRVDYTYRPDGYPTQIADSDTGVRRFDLDAIGQITGISGITGSQEREAYTYDAAGRISTALEQTSSGGDVVERTYTGTLLRSAGRRRYEYDAEGRVVRRSVKLLSGGTRSWRYTWSAEGRLTEVTTPDNRRWVYLYDPLGRRIAKELVSENGETVVERVDFFWDGSQLVEQVSDGRTTTWEWEPDDDRPVSQLDHDDVDSRFYAIVTDLVGSPTQLVDESGRTAWQASRTSLWGAANPGSGAGADCPLRFPGQYFDAETGLHYNLHRYYDPEVGRYQSPDPLGLAAAPDHHGYVFNPLAWADPLGLAPCKILADNDLMVKAMRGHAGALAEIQNKTVHITPNQLREFLNVTSGLNARRAFLRANDIKVIGGAQARQIASSPAFQEMFAKVMKAGHSRGDASLVAFAHASGIEGVTMEKRLSNYVIHTLRMPNVIRRVI